MALWQRENRSQVILHSDRGCQFISGEYQRFLKGLNLICSMCTVGSSANNASMEGFLWMLKRERVNRGAYQSRAEAGIISIASTTRAAGGVMRRLGRSNQPFVEMG